MKTERELYNIGIKRAIDIFGKDYLKKNYNDTCIASGYISDDEYQFFIGLKTKGQLQDRKADDHGWVVRALLIYDKNGKTISEEYETE